MAQLPEYKQTIKEHSGFTIVELLIVIVVIGILAAIILVAFNAVQDRARDASLKSDLSQAATHLNADKVVTDAYPATKEAARGGNGLKASPGTTFEYTPNNSATPPTFCLSAVNGSRAFHITNSGAPTTGVCSGHAGPVAGGGGGEAPSDDITIGSQTWAKTNVNVGTMVTGTTEQTNNSIVEKYCYNDSESNCSTYGALYQWNEAMQYSTTAGAQGICPAGWHIPTDNEWKTLEMALGMTQAQADATAYRGTDQGTQLKAGGSSGLNVPLGGNRDSSGRFYNFESAAFLWSSSESSGDAWRRNLYSGYATVVRVTFNKATGLSVRCLKN